MKMSESEWAEAEAMWLEADAKSDAGDDKGAFELLSRAAAMGHTGSYFNLGFCYDVGRGVAKSRTHAMRWYRRAWAEDGDWPVFNNIAILYAQGGNRRLAELWWRKALARHDGEAALELARLLLQSRRPSDVAKATRLLNLALSPRMSPRMSLAGEEEAQEILLQLKKSRRVALQQAAQRWRGQSRK